MNLIELFKGLAGFFLTMEEKEVEKDGETVVKKRPQVHHRGILTVLAFGTGTFILWAVGAIPHTAGFVLAADLESAVQAKLEPVAKKMGEIDTKVSAQGDALNEVLAALTAEKINATKRRVCKASDYQERSSLNTELNGHLQRYFKLTGTPYATPGCSEL